ncbi:MAG: hypothetical protein AB7J46_05580, partial [Candidatus Altimarinota bacterium]
MKPKEHRAHYRIFFYKIKILIIASYKPHRQIGHRVVGKGLIHHPNTMSQDKLHQIRQEVKEKELSR